MNMKPADKALKVKMGDKRKIHTLKEAVSFSKERAENTKKTGWHESGTGSSFIPKQYR